ncbi:MAG: NusA-like transcription termination signal-binding factor [Nitrososphaeria archaeon]|jgi:N utilization substance protein A
MSDEIKYTNEDLNLIKLFAQISGIVPKDLIRDDRYNRVIIVVKKDEVGKAVGKDGINVQYIRKTIKKDVVIVGYTDDIIEFVRGMLGDNVNATIREAYSPNGSKSIIIQVPQEQKGFVLGAKKQNIEKIKLLLKRYFGVENVRVV